MFTMLFMRVFHRNPRLLGPAEDYIDLTPEPNASKMNGDLIAGNGDVAGRQVPRMRSGRG